MLSAAQAAPRLMPGRIKADKSHDLSNISETGDEADFSQQTPSGEITNAGNGLEQIDFAFQVRKVFQMILNLVFDLGNLRINKGNVLLQLVAHGWQGGTFQAIDLLLAGLLQIVNMTHQRAQRIPGWLRRRPDIGLQRLTKGGNDGGIQFVGLTAAHLALGKAFDPSGINHTDTVALLMQELGDLQSVNPGGFQTHMSAAGLAFLQPVMQLVKALATVTHVRVLTVLPAQQTHIQCLFRHIHSQVQVHLHALPMRSVHLVYASSLRLAAASDTVRLLTSPILGGGFISPTSSLASGAAQ